MKTLASLIKTTVLGGVVFLLPLVLLVVIVGKAFNIMKTLSTPAANLISADKFAGYAVADLLAITVLLLITLLAGLLARSSVFDGFYQKLDAIILQIIPGYSWVKGMTGSLSDADAEKTLKPVAVIQDIALGQADIAERADNQGGNRPADPAPDRGHRRNL